MFLGRAVKSPQVRRADRKTKTKVAHILKITHRDQVEAPVTDWLREAYELEDAMAAHASARPMKPAGKKKRPVKRRTKARRG